MPSGDHDGDAGLHRWPADNPLTPGTPALAPESVKPALAEPGSAPCRPRAGAGAHVTVPAAFIAGESDVVVAANPDIVANVPSEVPDLRANVILPGCGHWAQQEKPEEVNRFVLDFCARVTGGTDIGR